MSHSKPLTRGLLFILYRYNGNRAEEMEHGAPELSPQKRPGEEEILSAHLPIKPFDFILSIDSPQSNKRRGESDALPANRWVPFLKHAWRDRNEFPLKSELAAAWENAENSSND